MKTKKLAAIGLFAATVLSLAACGGGGEGESSKGGGDGKLIVYTNSGSDGRDVWLEERAAEDGFDIEVVQIAAGDLANRIVSEKNNVQADLVFGLNNV